MRPAEQESPHNISPLNGDGENAADSPIPEGWMQLASEWGRLTCTDGVDLQQVLSYVLGLLHGLAIHYEDLTAQGGDDRPQPLTVWRDPDSGFREVLQDGFHADVVRCVREQRVVIEPVEQQENAYRLTVPVLPGRSAASLLLRVPTESAVHAAITVFQAGVGILLFALQKREHAQLRLAWNETAAWVEMCKRAMDAPYFSEAITVLAGDLQRHLGCEKVALGVCRGRRNRIEAVSGAAVFDSNSATVGLMEAVMAESRAADCPLSWTPDDNGSSTLANVAHQELALQSGAGEVHSYPLPFANGLCGGVLITLWRPEHRMDKRASCFLDAVTPHVAALVKGIRQSDPLSMRKGYYLCWKQLSERKRFVSKVALILVGILALLPIRQTIRVDSQLEPFERRIVPVRFDGLLRESMVRPGDQVVAGDLLARLDDQELTLREAELIAQRDRAVRRRDLAMTDNSAPVANIQIAQLEVASLERELQLLAYQREHLEIRSPIDGVVLAGDLDRSLGVPVSRGQALFEIGPLEQMVVELTILPRDVSLVQDNARVTLRLAGFPGKSWSITLDRVRPRTEMLGGRPVFVAEARLPDRAFDVPLRAGMHGKAKIHGRYRPVIWVLTRRLFDFIHVTLFW